MMGMIGDFHTTSLQPSTSNNTTGDIYGLQITSAQSIPGYQMVEDDNCDDDIDEDEEIKDEQCFNDEQTEYKQEYETDNENYSNYLIDQTYVRVEPKTISTQTQLRETYKKIQPVKRPGLVLKTPIAYQGDIDPSVIPIHRDGMGMCFFFFIIFVFVFILFYFLTPFCYPCLLFFIYTQNNIFFHNHSLFFIF